MVAGISAGGRCGAGGAGRGDSGCVRCTGRGGGRDTGGFTKSRELGAGSGSGTGGTENSKIGSVGTCSGSGFASDGGAGWGGSGAVDGSGGARACCWRSSRCGSVEGWGLAAVGLRGRPRFVGRLQADIRRRAVEHHHDRLALQARWAAAAQSTRSPPPIRTCSRIASARAAGGMCCNRGGARADVVGHGDPVLRAVRAGG